MFLFVLYVGVPVRSNVASSNKVSGTRLTPAPTKWEHMGAAEVMVPRVDAVRPVFLTVWSAVALVSEKKKDEQSSSQCKTFFFTSCLWANAGQHRRCAAAQPLGRLRRDRCLFLQAVRASQSSDTCWRRLNHVHSFPSWAVDTVWSVILTVAIFLFLCAQGVRRFLLLPMPDSDLITNLNTHFNCCFAVFWLRQINTYLLTFFSFIPTFCFNSKVRSLKSSRCL